jgi:hypothetical protein
VDGALNHEDLRTHALYADRIVRRDIVNALRDRPPAGPHARVIAEKLDSLVQERRPDLDRELFELIVNSEGQEHGAALTRYVAPFVERWRGVRRGEKGGPRRDPVIERLARARLRRDLRKYDHAEASLLPELRSEGLREQTGDDGKASSLQERFTELAREAETLQGATNPLDRNRARELNKQLQAALPADLTGWARNRLEAFKEHEERNLRWFAEHTFIRHAPHATPKERQQVERTVEEAWRTLSRSVHPEILGALPDVQVRVRPGRASYSAPDRVINLDPNAAARTVMHELGHHIESHTMPVQRLSMGQQMRRAYGYEARPRRNAVATEVGFPGVGRNDYRNRHYPGQLYTEIISTGIEKLASEKALAEALRTEPYATLQILTALQVPY